MLKSGSEAAYAQYLNSYIKYMKGQGIDLYYVSVQNEPDCSSDWTHWEPSATASFIANYGKEIWMTEVYVPNSNYNSANNWPEAGNLPLRFSRLHFKTGFIQ